MIDEFKAMLQYTLITNKKDVFKVSFGKLNAPLIRLSETATGFQTMLSKPNSFQKAMKTGNTNLCLVCTGSGEREDTTRRI